MEEKKFKKVTDLEFGDIVSLNAPYEEFTRDYYCGHSYKAVFGEDFRDKYLRTSKVRPVMVVSYENNVLTYCTVTSKSTSKHDKEFQYKCKQPIKTSENREYDSYIETKGIRQIKLKEHYHLKDAGKLAHVDKQNVLSEFTKQSSDYTRKKDIHRYGTPKVIRHLEKRWLENGFNKHDNKRIYSNDKMKISVSDKGVITYHQKRSLEEVQQLHRSPLYFERKEQKFNNQLIL